jgi:hypothetical protein
VQNRIRRIGRVLGDLLRFARTALLYTLLLSHQVQWWFFRTAKQENGQTLTGQNKRASQTCKNKRAGGRIPHSNVHFCICAHRVAATETQKQMHQSVSIPHFALAVVHMCMLH